MRVRARIAKADAAVNPKVSQLKDIVVEEVSIVDRPANKRSFLVVKSAAQPAGDDEATKAQWTTAFINDLPDSAFLYVESGGDKDEDGKTTPRSLRHFPVRGDDGKIDLPHLRNAAARIPQSDLSQDVKDKLADKAKKLLDDAGGTTKMKISSQEKARISQVVKVIQDALAAVSKALEGAEEAEGVETPAEVTKALAGIAKLLGVEEKPEPKPAAVDSDVEKAGRKISAQRLEALRQAQAALNLVISEAETAPKEEAADAEPAAKSAAPKTAPAVQPAVNDAILAAIKELTDTVGTLVKAAGIQKRRIDELSASHGGSRQVPVEKTDSNDTDDRARDVAWPLDMNRPHTRETTPVEKSFFE